MYRLVVINGKKQITKEADTDLSSPAILDLWVLKNFKSKGGYAVVMREELDQSFTITHYWKCKDGNWPQKYTEYDLKDMLQIMKILGA